MCLCSTLSRCLFQQSSINTNPDTHFKTQGREAATHSHCPAEEVRLLPEVQKVNTACTGVCLKPVISTQPCLLCIQMMVVAVSLCGLEWIGGCGVCLLCAEKGLFKFFQHVFKNQFCCVCRCSEASISLNKFCH